MKIIPKMMIEKGLLIPNGMGKPAQVGFDLTLKDVSMIQQGKILKDKSIIVSYLSCEKINLDPANQVQKGWVLDRGVYSLTFHQGIKLDKYHNGAVKHRSSVLRASAQITSGVYDPGFECDEIGATMFVHNEITIEEGARVAQLIIEENYPAEKYDGSYQGSKDLK